MSRSVGPCLSFGRAELGLSAIYFSYESHRVIRSAFVCAWAPLPPSQL